MEKKIGLYICKGCGIGEAINTEKIANIAKNALRVPVVVEHDFLCSNEGIELIKKDINEQGVNSIVIAGCSPRVKTYEFTFPGCFVERVPVRELAVWTIESPEEQQLAAEDYIKMGVIKAQKGEIPEPYVIEINRTILVVGGGISGMTAAVEAAKAGYDVVLVEKEAELGGFARKLYKKVPTDDYTKGVLADVNLEPLINEVTSNPKIKVYTSSKIEKIDGQPGDFDVTIAKNGSTETIKIGAIIQATGWKSYDAKKLAKKYGYGKFKDVVTNFEFEEIAKRNNGLIKRPSDSREVKSVLFVQCAGQRDPEHLPYCSGMCCTTSLKQARYVTDNNPEASAMIIYKDMRTPGKLEYYYKEAQNTPGVMLAKGEVVGIREEWDKLYVTVKDSILGEEVEIETEMVVLATGMVPTTKEPQDYLNGLAAAAAKGDEEKAKYLETTKKPEFILNLGYRQGPELPFLEGGFGFVDSNFICFQYETRRTGIYAVGPVRQPMNMTDAQEDARGAALKAIQCLEHVANGIAVHPRAWDTSFPEPNLTKCTACKRCTEECPFGAIDEDEKGTPFYKPNRCRRCGTCMGACPERIVSFKDYNVDMLGTMMKNVSVPEEEDRPRIIVLCCENDAFPATETAALNKLKLDPAVRFIQLRCLGSMNLVWIADALSKGVDGMLLLGCKFGEDYQCHFAKGSELAKYRLGKVQETLDRLQLESDRVQMYEVAIDEYWRIPQIINEFMDKIREIGPNPFKGF
ncbi:FAD-dependent oxidoreductase [Thermodesulfovibrio hydrogeniphilus]